MAIEAGKNGKCPHCGTATRFENVPAFVPGWSSGNFQKIILTDGAENGDGDAPNIEMRLARCGSEDCRRVILFYGSQMVAPLGAVRPPAPQEVPAAIADDYHEASLVEGLSAKASAALARRCLQNMLTDKAIKGIGKNDLDNQITEAMKTLPADLADNIDTIRVVGNFAAHPNKSAHSGDIVEVEPGEAEFLLDIIYDLFDFYYVRPVRSKAKKDAIQAKLKAAGSGAVIK